MKTVITRIKTEEHETRVDSKTVSITYYPKVIMAYTHAPQILIEGVRIDDVDV